MATVTAIYENGVLRPLTPLALPEHTRVQIQVQPVPAPSDAAVYRRRVREALVAAGLSVPDPQPLPATPSLSPERRAELARRFSTGRPLSEWIIAEREGR
ncbi:MAG TPA: antitoxin family protein [Anaerolineae bacterium]